jgi:DNA-binding PadR family transcriptional regulator
MSKRIEPVSLSLNDWLVLGVLCEQARHGFDVAREVAADSPLGRIWTVRRPLVYRAIDHLRELGLAEARGVEQGARGPDRVVVAPTRRGRDALRRWLAAPVEHPREVRTELLAKLALLERRGEPLAPLAGRQRDAFGAVLQGLERRVDEVEGADRLATLWRREANRAIRSFLDAVIAEDRRLNHHRPPG